MVYWSFEGMYWSPILSIVSLSFSNGFIWLKISI